MQPVVRQRSPHIHPHLLPDEHGNCANQRHRHQVQPTSCLGAFCGLSLLPKYWATSVVYNSFKPGRNRSTPIRCSSNYSAMSSHLPPGIDLSKIPSAKPPPGVEPNFIDPVSRAYDLRVACGTITAITMIFVSLRMYGKVFVVRSIGWEDGGFAPRLEFTWLRGSFSCLYHCDSRTFFFCLLDRTDVIKILSLVYFGLVMSSTQCVFTPSASSADDKIVFQNGIGAHMWDVSAKVVLNSATDRVSIFP